MLVVKLGGGDGMDVEACVDDIAALWHRGTRLVIVHGGADETTELGERLGHPARFVQSPNGMTSRYTDRETVEILAMACAGRRNVTMVEALQQRGVNAVGLSGVDGQVLRGPRKATITVVEPTPRAMVKWVMSARRPYRQGHGGQYTSAAPAARRRLSAGTLSTGDQ